MVEIEKKEIPTIEEALINLMKREAEKRNETFTEEEAQEVRTSDVFSPLKQFCIDFAGIHVEAALKLASEAITNGTNGEQIYPENVLNAYPLENIK